MKIDYLLPFFLGNTPTKKEEVCMESKLIQKIRLELQMNRLLKQINSMECSHKTGFMCKQCIYNVGSVTPICSKTE